MLWMWMMMMMTIMMMREYFITKAHHPAYHNQLTTLQMWSIFPE